MSEHIRPASQSAGVGSHGRDAERDRGGRDERGSPGNGDTLTAGLVVVGIGIELNTEIARDAGLELNHQGALVVDEYLRTSDADIFAAGDIAAWPDRTSGKRLRVEHWDVARRHGLRAGGNMAGDMKAYTALPYFFSDMFDIVSRHGAILSEWDATVTRGSIQPQLCVYYFARQLCGVVAAAGPTKSGSRHRRSSSAHGYADAGSCRTRAWRWRTAATPRAPLNDCHPQTISHRRIGMDFSQLIRTR